MSSVPRRIGPRAPSFYAFLVAQFLGALNDNAFKVTLVTLVLATVTDPAIQVFYSSVATACLPIPFLLFSPLAGFFADRFPKHRVLLATKAPEILAMALGVFAFAARDVPMLLAVFFLMAAQSAFFSPAKYGILPEVFAEEHLSKANALLELTTNLAILSGSAVGVVVYSAVAPDLEKAGLVYLGIAVIGTVAVAFAPRAPDGNPEARFAWNLLASAGEDWREVRRSPLLVLAVLGIAWFSFLGSLVLTVLPVFGRNSLGLSEERSAALLALLSIGIGAGSLLAARLSRAHVEIGLVPVAGLALAVLGSDLGWNAPDAETKLFGMPVRAIVDLAALGVAGGLFIVPLNALLQQRSPAGMKGRLVAFSNVVSFAAVLLSAGTTWLSTSLVGWGSGTILVSASLSTAVGTIASLALLPELSERAVLVLLSNLFYRTRVRGTDRLPETGAILVVRATAREDLWVLGTASGRRVRLVVEPQDTARRACLRWLYRRLGAIPAADESHPEGPLQVIQDALERGEFVGFPAGQLGGASSDLLERVLREVARPRGFPALPVTMIRGRSAGSAFSRLLPRFVEVEIGDCLPPEMPLSEILSRTEDLASALRGIAGPHATPQRCGRSGGDSSGSDRPGLLG